MQVEWHNGLPPIMTTGNEPQVESVDPDAEEL
jgi:hypothetical protein